MNYLIKKGDVEIAFGTQVQQIISYLRCVIKVREIVYFIY